jgi:hypothetical protein
VKRLVFGFLIAAFVCTPLLAQQVKTKKSTLAPKEQNTFHLLPVVALNTRTGQSLVAWEKATNNIYSIIGMLINSKGNPASGLIHLADSRAAHPTLVYNSERNEFLLGYDDNPTIQSVHSDIFVRRLNAQGNPIAAATKATSDTVSSAMANLQPKLAYNPKNDTYALVWIREIVNTNQLPDENNGLVGAILSGGSLAAGNISLFQRTLIENNLFLWPTPLDLAYQPTNEKLLLAFVQVLAGTNGSQANYTLGTLEPNLSNVSPTSFGPINTKPVGLSPQFSWGVQLAFLEDGTGFVYFVDSPNIKRRKLSNLGRLTGPAVAALRKPKNFTKLFFPSFDIVNGPSGPRGILLAVEGPFSIGGAATIWVQFLNAKGLTVGAPIKVETTIATETAVGTALVAIPQPANSSTYKFAAFYVQAAFLGDGTFQSSGILELNLDATIP